MPQTYPKAFCVMKAPPDKMKTVSFNAKDIKSLLNKVTVLDIILKVKHVTQFPKKIVKRNIVKMFVIKKIRQKKSSKNSSKNETGFFKNSGISIKKSKSIW